MWKQISDWFAAILITAAFAVSLYGAAEWTMQHFAESVPATADAPVIVVDAGHGGADGGAVGTETGVIEAGLNLQVATLVADGLSASGVHIVMTRTDDLALAATKQADMAARRKLFNGPNVELVISVHMNKFTDRSVSGPMAYYMPGSAEGQKLAQSVIDALCDATERPRRLANPGDYFVVRECACPAVLVECGFLSNAADEASLSDPAHRQALADAIVAGVLEYRSRQGA